MLDEECKHIELESVHQVLRGAPVPSAPHNHHPKHDEHDEEPQLDTCDIAHHRIGGENENCESQGVEDETRDAGSHHGNTLGIVVDEAAKPEAKPSGQHEINGAGRNVV